MGGRVPQTRQQTALREPRGDHDAGARRQAATITCDYLAVMPDRLRENPAAAPVRAAGQRRAQLGCALPRAAG